MKSLGRVLLALILALAAGCSILNPAEWLNLGGEVTPAGDLTPVTPTTTPTFGPTLTQTPNNPRTLTLWLPPQFDPKNSSTAGQVLQNRLEGFLTDHPGVQINLRIKAASGPGGLLETLTAASDVAPDVVPSLIALPRPELETAALKGLIYPLDADSAGLQGSDWFAYARDLSQVQGTVFGLPFAGDALVLLYRPASLVDAPQNWEQLMLSGQRLALPAGDPQSLVTLAMYLSANGAITDEQGRPLLQADVLKQVLDLYSRALGLGVILPGMVDVATDGLAWQTYKDGGAQMLITWASRYLADPPADTTAALVPSLTEQTYALADGWSWAVADPQPARRLLAIELAEYLADAQFLAEWSQSAGYLPVRPSSLEVWTDFRGRDLAGQFALAARLRPANDLVVSLGPVLQEAAHQVLTRQNDSLQAAQAAAERLAHPHIP
jgi:multiple sugar transport system substrate-binding protein